MTKQSGVGDEGVISNGAQHHSVISSGAQAVSRNLLFENIHIEIIFLKLFPGTFIAQEFIRNADKVYNIVKVIL